MQAYKVWPDAKPNLLHASHQLVPTVAKEHFEPLASLIESQELVLSNTDALDQDIILLVLNNSEVLAKLVSVFCIETNNPAANLVLSVVEKYKICSTDEVANRAIAIQGGA